MLSLYACVVRFLLDRWSGRSWNFDIKTSLVRFECIKTRTEDIELQLHIIHASQKMLEIRLIGIYFGIQAIHESQKLLEMRLIGRER